MSISNQLPFYEYENKQKIVRNQEKKVEKLNLKTRKLMKLSRTRYLWILIKDIFLSSALTFTCILVGENLLSQRSLYKGAIMLIIPWFPAILLIPHELYQKSVLIPKLNSLPIILMTLAALIFFPILPLSMHLHLLYGSKDYNYFSRLDYLHNVMKLLQSSVHLVLLLDMAARGELLVENVDATCISDELGRSACVSLSIQVNAVITLALLVLSSISLQISEYTEHTKVKVLSSFPFAFCTLMFRMVSYSLMIIYIDVWAIIPISCVIFIYMILHGYTATYLDSAEELDKDKIDSVDGPHTYALIWNGNEWSSKLSDSTDQNSSKENNKTYKIRCSPILQGFISSVIYIPTEQDGTLWGTLCACMGNGILVIVVATIYVLVNYVDSFQYKQNFINNAQFCTICNILIVYALLSPICVITKNSCWNNSFRLICSFLALILIVLVPFTIVMFMNNTVSINNYLFTIEESSKGAVISTIVPMKRENEYQKKYMYPEIYWDKTCAEPLTPNHRLVFVNDKNQACKEIMKTNITSINVYDNVNLRSSSPNQHDIPRSQIIELQSAVKRLGVLFTSDKDLTAKSVGQYLSCSDSDQIHIIHDSRSLPGNMNPIKTLHKDGLISERISVTFKNVQHTADVQCKLIPTKIKLFHENIEIQPSKINNTYICCLNNTHYLESFGLCPMYMNKLRKVQPGFIKHGYCSDKNVQTFIKFIQYQSCILKVSFTSSCLDYLVVGPCYGSICN